MDTRYSIGPEEGKSLDTKGLRQNFLIENLFRTGEINLIYSHVDRIIVGGAYPVHPLRLEGGKSLGTDYFLERRELGIINIGECIKIFEKIDILVNNAGTIRRSPILEYRDDDWEAVMNINLLLVTFVPQISLWLPKLAGLI